MTHSMDDHERAVRADLDRWGPPLAGSALAATALGLARRLDDAETSAGAAAQLARELRATMLELGRLAPAEDAEDELQKLRSKRERRRGAS